MEDFDRPILHDDECEEIVLGTLIANSTAMLEARPLLNANLFHNINNREMYSIIEEMEQQGKEVDMFTIARELEKKQSPIDAMKVVSMASKRVIAGAIEHVQHLQELSVRRKIVELCAKNMLRAEDLSTDVDDVVTNINDTISSIYQESTVDTKSLRECWQDLRVDIKNNYEGTELINGSKTGFDRLDSRGGFHPEDLVIIAGATSQGKTSLALSIAMNVMRNDDIIAFYSMEMSGKQLAARAASVYSKVNSSKLLYGQLTHEEFVKFDNTFNAISVDNMYIDEKSTSSIDKLINSIRTMVMRYNIKGAIIDYIQLVNTSVRGLTEEQGLAQAVRRLKNLAKDASIWIVLLSQLSRDTLNPEPSINRLRGSGQIAEAADIVLLVYRPEIYNRNFPEPFATVDVKNKAMIEIAKGRNIGTGKFICNFEAETTHFYEWNGEQTITDKKNDDPLNDVDLNNPIPGVF